MLKRTIFELLFRIIPEDFAIFIGAYIFSNIKFDKKRICISAVLLAIGVFVIRLFPIEYGIHIAINILIIVLLLIFINNFDVLKAISSSFLLIIILQLCELANVFILRIFNVPEELFNKNFLYRYLTGLPSLFLFIFVVYLMYVFMKRGSMKVL